MTAWILLGLAVAAAGLVVWAAITGRPAGDPRPVRVPRHAHWTTGDTTRRLVPPAMPTSPAVPPISPAPARPLARPENLPWRAHDDRPHDPGPTAD